MKLPRVENTPKYQGLYVYDFGDWTAVGYTAGEIAILVESERYRGGKAYSPWYLGGVSDRCSVRVYDSAGCRSNGEPWRKAVVVNTLQARYGLRRPTARILAREIETRVLALEYPLVSTGLINELMRNELLAWGFDDQAVEPAQVDRSPNPVAGGPPPGREE